MNQKVETHYRFDWFKWVIVVALVAAGVIGNQYYSEQLLIYRVLALLAAGAVAILIATQTAQGASLWNLLKESLVEVRRVVWPSVQETHQTTLIVLVVVFVMMIILWILDTFLGWIASLILG